MQGTEHQHKGETETIERLESKIKDQKNKVAMDASTRPKPEIRSKKTSKA